MMNAAPRRETEIESAHDSCYLLEELRYSLLRTFRCSYYHHSAPSFPLQNHHSGGLFGIASNEAESNAWVCGLKRREYEGFNACAHRKKLTMKFVPNAGSHVLGSFDGQLFCGKFNGAGPWRLSSVEVVWLRSEEHTSELQSLMRISYAVFCLKKKKKVVKYKL